MCNLSDGVGLTLISWFGIFSHLANLISHLCQFPISPGRGRNRTNQSQPNPVSNLTLPSVVKLSENILQNRRSNSLPKTVNWACLNKVGLNLFGKVVDGHEVDLLLTPAAARHRCVGRYVARGAAPWNKFRRKVNMTDLRVTNKKSGVIWFCNRSTKRWSWVYFLRSFTYNSMVWYECLQYLSKLTPYSKKL